MTIRQRYRYREFSIEPDREPDAEPITYTMCCCVCDASGPPTLDPQVSASWISNHLTRAPDHLTYRECVSRPYRAVPGAWL